MVADVAVGAGVFQPVQALSAGRLRLSNSFDEGGAQCLVTANEDSIPLSYNCGFKSP
jgi:hypothetical protein